MARRLSASCGCCRLTWRRCRCARQLKAGAEGLLASPLLCCGRTDPPLGARSPLPQAAERLGGVQQEAAILRHVAALPEEERQRQREARQAAGPPPDLLRQLHAAAGGLASGAAQRQRLADGVFKPSYLLPTMSVEQFGEVEYAR